MGRKQNKKKVNKNIFPMIALYLFLFIFYILYGISMISGGNIDFFSWTIIIFNIIIMWILTTDKFDNKNKTLKVFDNLNRVFIVIWAITLFLDTIK
jgi:hypothetical protein